MIFHLIKVKINRFLLWKRNLLYTPLLKWYIQQGLKLTKFYCAIKYTPEKSFQQFADEVSDAWRAGDVDDSKKLIADTMKLFGNSAYGKTVTNKEKFVSTSYGNASHPLTRFKLIYFGGSEEIPSYPYYY